MKKPKQRRRMKNGVPVADDTTFEIVTQNGVKGFAGWVTGFHYDKQPEINLFACSISSLITIIAHLERSGVKLPPWSEKNFQRVLITERRI